MLPLACAALMYSNGAVAQISQTIHPFVSVGYTYDDNLLRLPDQAVGVEQRSDRMTQALAGVQIDRPVGRQNFTATAKVTRVTFDHYDQLDYNGKDFKAEWAWRVGNYFDGTLGATYEQTLTPFTDYHSDERNLRTQRREYVSGGWRFHPRWRVRTGAERSRYTYELSVQRGNNRETTLAELGVDYLAPSGDRIGLVARQFEGSYRNARNVNGVLLQDDYKQDELKANILWTPTGVTQVQVLAGYARRRHDAFTARDSSGANGRITVAWAPTGKLKFTGAAWREFAAVESSVVNNSLNSGGSLAATWSISAKVQANASVRRETREFERLAGSTLASDDLSDRIRGATVGLTYAPIRSVQLSLSGFADRRSGNPIIGTSDYKAKGVAANVTLQF
ncbi:XrtB/PEP-CTERM-associated polysaccharide biosynthesis outer membrane protein EpsL [Massilia sp. METH4]|uniref:XrtB/PEP-CTERM-associated polysaccharide biosynthesis outer membrane protein EpsL n=1 Tax=Massilia sp. METH4 TaxID=3123041 RepID=UPI0030D3D867